MGLLAKGPIATILNGQSQSQEIDLGESQLVGLVMPATWTAANLTILAASSPGGTFNPLHDEGGTEITITAAAARQISISSAKLQGARFIKVRSGTSGAPVNQAADRQIQLLVKDLN